jgi:ABC-2 type transport system permease protein
MANKILLIAGREIKTKFKSVWFWLIPLVIPLIFLMFTGIGYLIGTVADNSSEVYEVGIVDRTTNSIYAKAIKSKDSLKISIPEKLPVQDEVNSIVKQAKKDNVKKGFIIISGEDKVDSTIKFQLITPTAPSQNSLSALETQLKEIRTNNNLEKLSLSKENLEIIQRFTFVENLLIGDDGNSKVNINNAVFGISYFIAIAIYMISTIFGSSIMLSVLEEKSNRIIEVILSTVTTTQLLVGKILGQGAVIITQILLTTFASIVILIGTVITTLIFNKPSAVPTSNIISAEQLNAFTNSPQTQYLFDFAGQIINSIEINFGLFVLLTGFYFFMGVLFSALWFAAIGATSDTYQGASNSALNWLISIPSVFGLIFLSSVAIDPGSMLSRIVSIFPLTSYLIMPARLPFGVPGWELALSMILLMVTIYLSFIFAGKLYKTGLLMYGKNASIKELWRWLK